MLSLYSSLELCMLNAYTSDMQPPSRPPPLVAKQSRTPAFEKVPFEDAASILWKHVTARRFRFVYHYHPEIELIYFVQGGGIEFVGGSGQVFNPGHLVLLGSNLPHLWINDAKCHYAEICEVLIELRISYACKLLRDTDKNIAEIAYDCGYSNLANFNRQFRWRCRMAPKTYRKHWPEEEAA
jgi:quercetin dioxygenase-like cupin family protein